MRRLGEGRQLWSERGLFEFFFSWSEQFLMITKLRNIYFEQQLNSYAILCYLMEELGRWDEKRKRRREEGREGEKKGRKERKGRGMLSPRSLLMILLQQGCLGTSNRNHCHMAFAELCANISSVLKLFLWPSCRILVIRLVYVATGGMGKYQQSFVIWRYSNNGVTSHVFFMV